MKNSFENTQTFRLKLLVFNLFWLLTSLVCSDQWRHWFLLIDDVINSYFEITWWVYSIFYTKPGNMNYCNLTYSCHKFSSFSSNVSCTLSGWIFERATFRRDSRRSISLDFCDKSICSEEISDLRFFTWRSWASSGASAKKERKEWKCHCF